MVKEYIEIDKNTFPTPFTVYTGEYARGWNACLNSVLQHKALTIEPMRHGEWKEETEYYADDYSECNVRKVYACSLCGRTEKRKEPYCNCGAKMDRHD